MVLVSLTSGYGTLNKYEHNVEVINEHIHSIKQGHAVTEFRHFLYAQSRSYCVYCRSQSSEF